MCSLYSNLNDSRADYTLYTLYALSNNTIYALSNYKVYSLLIKQYMFKVKLLITQFMDHAFINTIMYTLGYPLLLLNT